MKLQVVGLFLGVTAIASAIPITNPSFETPPPGGLINSCGTGCAYAAGANDNPGWVTTGYTGEWQPGAGGGAFFNSIPDGITIAFTQGGTLSQNVGTVSAAGQMYTLVVYEGLQKGNGGDSLGTTKLVIGGTSITATGTAPTAGNWAAYTANYTTVAGDVGSTLSILLTGVGAESEFDNASLNLASAATPEPMSMALAGLGLALLGLVGRRKRA